VAERIVSELFDPLMWRTVSGFDFTDITYHRQVPTVPTSRSSGSPSTGRRYATPSGRGRSMSSTVPWTTRG